MKRTLICSLAGIALMANTAAAAEPTPTEAKINKALSMEYRTAKDRARDGNRAPSKALAFMGVEHDMDVFEFGPGDGWYTKILAPVLADKGSLTIGYPGKYPKAWTAELDALLETPTMKDVRKVTIPFSFSYDILAWEFDAIDFQSKDLDMFLMIREYHNLIGDDRASFNREVFKSLKPGGRYVIIDHTRRHMQKDSPENFRREDPVVVMAEVLEAGFSLVSYSDMFYKADDTLEYEVARRSVKGNTDRFFFVFEKPAS